MQSNKDLAFGFKREEIDVEQVEGAMDDTCTGTATRPAGIWPERLGGWFAADFHGGCHNGDYDGARAREAHIFFPTAVRVWRRS